MNSPTPTLDRWINRASYILHPTLVAEEGAEEAIMAHQEQGGNFLIVATHFKRVGLGHLAVATTMSEALVDIPRNTGVTPKAALKKVPVLRKIIEELNHGEDDWVERATDHVGENSQHKADRHSRNALKIANAAKDLSAGRNRAIWPEGTTKKIIWNPDGTIKKKLPRDPGVLLKMSKGGGHMLNQVDAEARENIRIIGFAEHFSGRFSYLSPIIAVTKPEVPVDGSVADWMTQIRNILQRGLDLAMSHDESR